MGGTVQLLHVLNPRGAYAGKMRVTGNKVTFWLLTEVGRLLSAEYHRSRVELLLWQSAKNVGQKAQKCDEQLCYLTKKLYLCRRYENNHYQRKTAERIHCLAFRTSMKHVSDLLCRQSYIMQCHRAFIVNLRHVRNVESRNSGISLIMQYGDEAVLVSKQYAAEVKERIKNPDNIFF